MTERFRFDVGGEKLTALVYTPVKPVGSTLLLGHGASAGQRDQFIVDYATALAQRGVLVVTFDFPFMEHERKRPDPGDVLEEACRSAIVAARECRPKNHLFVGGKSLGGRIASEVVAAGGDDVDDVDGVVVLGYPLHPVGKPTAARARHLRDLTVPVLIVQGTHDVFGTPGEVRRILRDLPRGSEVHPVDGDHSFKGHKNGALTQREIEDDIHDEIARWISEVAAMGPRALSRPRPVAAHMRTQLRALRRRAPH